jgi:long-subunit fatty acid transport protein
MRSWVVSRAGLVASDKKLTAPTLAGATGATATNPAWIPNGFVEGPLYGNGRWTVVLRRAVWPKKPIGTIGTFPGVQFLAPRRHPDWHLRRARSSCLEHSRRPSRGSSEDSARRCPRHQLLYDVPEARLDHDRDDPQWQTGTSFGWSVALLYICRDVGRSGITYRSKVGRPDSNGNLVLPP